MDEGEIPGSFFSSSPSHGNFHQSESMKNFLLFVQQFSSSDETAAQVFDSEVAITGTNQLQSSNSAAAQDVYFEYEEEDAVSVTGTNSNSELRSDSYLEFMAEQLPPLDSALEHEITKSKSPMYAAVVDSSKVASCSNSIDLVPLPLNSASSFSVPLPMPPVDFVSERTYYKSKPDLPCSALNQEFNVVNNTQFQPPNASTNAITSYHDLADEFVSLQLNSTVTGVVSSPLPMAPPHPHAVDFNSMHAYYKSRPEISCAVANQVNQQFNVVNNTQSQPPIANTNGITFLS